jgi:hypothetical protein
VTAVRVQRMAAGWFLGCVLFAAVVFAWLRGAGRVLVPLLLVGGLVYAAHWFVRKVREPVD